MSLDHDRARQLHAAANNPPDPAALRAVSAYLITARKPASAEAVAAAADYIEGTTR